MARPIPPVAPPLAVRGGSDFSDRIEGTLQYIDAFSNYADQATAHIEGQIDFAEAEVRDGYTPNGILRISPSGNSIQATGDYPAFFDGGYAIRSTMDYASLDSLACDFTITAGSFPTLLNTDPQLGSENGYRYLDILVQHVNNVFTKDLFLEFPPAPRNLDLRLRTIISHTDRTVTGQTENLIWISGIDRAFAPRLIRNSQDLALQYLTPTFGRKVLGQVAANDVLVIEFSNIYLGSADNRVYIATAAKYPDIATAMAPGNGFAGLNPSHPNYLGTASLNSDEVPAGAVPDALDIQTENNPFISDCRIYYVDCLVGDPQNYGGI